MPFLNRSHLFFDYRWPHGQAVTIVIDIDESTLDKHDGHQVLAILNHMFSQRKFWDDRKALMLMEHAIKKLPENSLTKIETVSRLVEILDDL